MAVVTGTIGRNAREERPERAWRPRRPQGELFGDQTAKAVWAAFCELDEGLQHEFLAALQARLADPGDRTGPHAIRTAKAIAALREAHGLGGGPLSVERYKSLRLKHPERSWPAPATICRWLGRRSWNEALRDAHLDLSADGDALVVARPRSYSSEEVLAAIRECVADLGDRGLSVHTYITWARRADVRARPGRRPLAQHAFDAHFGGWMRARAAALEGRKLNARGRVRLGSIRPPAGYRYDDRDFVSALCEVATRVGCSPRTTEYQYERLRILAAERVTEKPLRPFPSYNIIQGRYGTWDAALAAAGLEPFGDVTLRPADLRRGARRRLAIPREVMLACLRAAYAAQGDPFSSTAYDAWRREQLALPRRHREHNRIPCRTVIWQQFGRWHTALAAAGIQLH